MVHGFFFRPEGQPRQTRRVFWAISEPPQGNNDKPVAIVSAIFDGFWMVSEATTYIVRIEANCFRHDWQYVKSPNPYFQHPASFMS